MRNNEIFILGVGHNTIVFIDLLESSGYKIQGLFHYNDERVGENIHGHNIIGSFSSLFASDNLEGKQFALSMGDNNIRADLAEKIRSRGGILPKIIHPTAIVSKYSDIEDGVVIHANSVVQPDTCIGKDTIISYNCSVTHNSSIGESCYIAFGACIGAYVKIGDNVFIGQAASIVSGKVSYIGNNSIIGAGSVVIENIEAKQVVAGNPAKVIRILD